MGTCTCGIKMSICLVYALYVPISRSKSLIEKKQNGETDMKESEKKTGDGYMY